MSTEQILKFQPDRTLYLRGFDGTGAAASLCQTSPTGFTVCGVFRDMADFCVLVLYDADNIFEHYTVRYLPDFDLTGMVLSFNLSYQGLQPIDSAKYSWIDWAQLDVINATATKPPTVTLWDHATLVSGDYSVAQGVYTFTAPGGCVQYDRLTLFVNNASFDFLSDKGGESAADVAQWFATAINTYPWSSFLNSSIAVMASVDGTGQLTLKNARAGHVNVSGTNVEWLDVIKFPGIAAGSTIYIAGTPYTIATVDSPTSLTLTTAGTSGLNVPYLAEYGGLDGNDVAVYMVVRTGNYLKVDPPLLQLSGGNSDNVVWNVSLDFSALGVDQLRQAWLTFAPALPGGAAYADTEWTATFSNWSVADPNNKRTLQIAGPGSLRIGNDETGSCSYSAGWRVQPANNYWHGFSRVSDTPGSSVTVSYTFGQAHDLYLGTSLYIDRGIVGVSLDGNALSQLDCYLETGAEVVTRRLLKSGLAAGAHILSLTLGSTHNGSSSGFNFIFDYLEAALPTANIEDAVVTYGNVSPALDFDTDATYKMSPQRLLWHIQKLGFRGQLNEYLGVFWWNQRTRVAAHWNSAIVTISPTNTGTWTDLDTITVAIGSFTMTKSLIYWDTAETIAQHFVSYINSATVSMRAAITGSGQFTIYPRTPNWGNTLAVASNSASPQWAISKADTLDIGVPGDWQVDPTASNPINFPLRQWHSDLFSEVKAAGLLITTSFSMELVNPPDDGSVANCWQARFSDNTRVTTDTDFHELFSSQCAFVANMTAFQSSVFTVMAGLQSAAGLTPWLQFGEFLWWFFSSIADPVFSCSSSNPATFQLTGTDGLVTVHKMQTGDRVVISGVLGCPNVNGTWTITVIDSTQFSIPVSPNGVWTPGTGQVRGGSMAYYDPVTSAAAQTALGRPLYKFTCQDDDPTVNQGADAAFLASRLKAHVDTIRAAVLAQYPAAKFEILYPNDVNNSVCLLGPEVQFAQGGRLNAAVNLPPEWRVQAGSGLDRFKVEALSWGATYLNLDLANQAIVFALSNPMAWTLADVAYLVPWFNGTCPWPREFHLANSRGVALINLWAYDHLALMSWPLPFPTWLYRSDFAG